MSRARETEARVERMLNELRISEGISDEKVEKESKKVFEVAQMTGRIYGKVFAAVPLVLIHIDEAYQRTETFSKYKGDQIAYNFKEEVYEPIKLNYRDGAFWCPSGQHRTYAHLVMKRDYIVAEIIHCSRAEEISVFLFQDDNRSKLSPYDRWKAGCELGLPADLELKNISEKYGISVDKRSGEACISSITTAKDIIESQEKGMLNLIFDTIVESGWKDKAKGWDSRFVRSLWSIYKKTAPADRKETKRKLVNYLCEKTPAEAMATAVSNYAKDPQAALIEMYRDIITGRRVGKIARK